MTSSPHLGRTSVLVFNAVETGPGRFEPNLSNPLPVCVKRCQVQETRTERELRDDTDVAVARYELFAPAGAPVKSTSKVRVVSRQPTATHFVATDGKSYFVTDVKLDVDGEVTVWADRQDRAHHVECYLKERKG